jgi:hypothetical protein
MRLDKDIWKVTCVEYDQLDPTALTLDFWQPRATAFVSMWLELLNDDRAPATRALRYLSLPDLCAELRLAVSVYRDRGSEYRLHSALRGLISRVDRLPTTIPGRDELVRLGDFAVMLRDLLEATDKNKVIGPTASRFQILQKDVESFLIAAVEQLAIALHAQVKSGEDYVNALVQSVKSLMLDDDISLWTFVERGQHVAAIRTRDVPFRPTSPPF